jgi:hypothetical protein
MLITLLRLLAEGRLASMPELAGRLGVDQSSLAVAIAHCQRLGYLEAVDAACATAAACRGCPVAGACLPGETGGGRGPGVGAGLPMVPTWWRLTERGIRAVEVSSPTPA